jgi:AcrR family transcriptional regulator
MSRAKRKPSTRSPRASGTTEERLLKAVEELMRSQGLARITIRDIARVAGLAEGTLYNHFRDKDEIFLAVLERNVAEFSHVLQDLPLRVGQATVLDNLRPVAAAAAGFHIKVAPLICSLLADQKLLVDTRRRMQERQIGPQRSSEALGAYLAAEQRLGRITSEVDATVVAGLILGTSFQMAVLDHFSGRPPDERQSRARMRHAIQAIVIGLTPRAPQET